MPALKLQNQNIKTARASYNVTSLHESYLMKLISKCYS